MADAANRSRGSGRRVRGAFAPEARCGYQMCIRDRVIAVGGVAMLCFSELLAAPLSRFFVGYDAELLLSLIHIFAGKTALR